jgi:hypothetical protein
MDRTTMIEQVASQIYVNLVTDRTRDLDAHSFADIALAQAKIFANTILKAQQTELWPMIKTNGESKQRE